MKTIKRGFGTGGAHIAYDLKGILEELQGLFSASAGHDHSGTDKGKPVGSDGLADGNLFALEFYRQDVAPNQNYVPIEVVPGVTEVVMPRSGSVIAISVTSSAARTAGWASFSVFRNGTMMSGCSAYLDSTTPQYGYITLAKGTKTFAAGDKLSVRVNSDASLAPATMDVCVVVWLSI
ncbi:MAG: hypothetical protein ACUVTZ_08550 [Armatimonadota bacterium]